jgi:hypothetical protein
MVDVCVALDLLLPLLSNTIYETGATSVFALDGGDGLYRMRPTARLCTCLGKTEVLDLAFGDQVWSKRCAMDSEAPAPFSEDASQSGRANGHD